VTLTVTDDRGGETVEDLTVTVEKPKKADESPGFGAVLAAVAMLALLLVTSVGRRRS
jgi:hypothetical protein